MYKKILVERLEKGERRTQGGIILRDDNGKSEGIRPRWAKIHSVGPGINDPDLEPGKWVLVEHGRWTRGLDLVDDDGERFTLWGIDWPDAVLCVSDEQPVEFAHRF